MDFASHQEINTREIANTATGEVIAAVEKEFLTPRIHRLSWNSVRSSLHRVVRRKFASLPICGCSYEATEVPYFPPHHQFRRCLARPPSRWPRPPLAPVSRGCRCRG